MLSRSSYKKPTRAKNTPFRRIEKEKGEKEKLMLKSIADPFRRGEKVRTAVQ